MEEGLASADYVAVGDTGVCVCVCVQEGVRHQSVCHSDLCAIIDLDPSETLDLML